MSVGHSELDLHPMGVQPVKGFPSKPARHLQLALWLRSKHSELAAQGSSTRQGRTQLPE